MLLFYGFGRGRRQHNKKKRSIEKGKTRSNSDWNSDSNSNFECGTWGLREGLPLSIALAGHPLILLPNRLFVGQFSCVPCPFMPDIISHSWPLSFCQDVAMALRPGLPTAAHWDAEEKREWIRYGTRGLGHVPSVFTLARRVLPFDRCHKMVVFPFPGYRLQATGIQLRSLFCPVRVGLVGVAGTSAVNGWILLLL